MSVTLQLSLPSVPHNNRQLFSDHYLNETLPNRDDWDQLVPPIQAAMAQIAAIYRNFTPSEKK